MNDMTMHHRVIRILFLLASGIWGVYSLKITKLTVPDFVRNGTEDSVLLDCEYEYEKNADTKLVVKWFHNDDPNPVYQWIPEHNTRQASGKFGDKINTDYEVTTGDDWTRYRALNILRPTTQMSGMYSCYVTSLAGFDSKEDSMIIYALPTSVYVNVSVVEGTVNIMCVVEGVSPVPEMKMFHIEPGQMDATNIDDVYQSYIEEEDAYNVFLATNISEHELDGFNFFGCIVTIEGAEYEKEVKIPYVSMRRGYRPGLRRKIHSASSMLHSYDPEVLDVQDNFNFLYYVAASHDNFAGEDEDDDDDGALTTLPSSITILLLVGILLVLHW